MSAPRTLVVELVGGSSREAARLRAQGADVRALVLGDAGHGTSFTLVARIVAALEEHAPTRVIAPAPRGASGERRAVAAACAAACAGRAGLTVVLEDSDGAIEELAGTLALARAREALGAVPLGHPLAATAVISTWNKCADVCANLDGLRAQVRPFSDIVVVDNASNDATARTIRERYPEVRLVVMPHSAYGACETFNIGFASAVTPLVAILDDDVVLPPDWLEKTVARLEREPATTAIVSSEVEEPGMPAGYLEQEHLRRERYMSTFRGCASLARTEAIRRAGFYDERLFIYGNERDLTCRLLNLGFRVLQYPSARAFHKTPFGIKMGKRSLYFHARNAWLTQLKYAPFSDLARLPWLVLTKVLMRGESSERKGQVSDATGTIGIGKSVRQTPGALGVLARAAFSVLANVPYCLKHRAPCRAPDFELPLK